MSELSHYIASLGTILPLFAALFRLRSYVQTYCLEYWGQQKERIPASFEAGTNARLHHTFFSFALHKSSGYLIMTIGRGPHCPRTPAKGCQGVPKGCKRLPPAYLATFGNSPIAHGVIKVDRCCLTCSFAFR